MNEMQRLLCWCLVAAVGLMLPGITWAESLETAETLVESAVVAGGESQVAELRADDVWLISSRCLGCPNWDKTSEPELEVQHYGTNEEWQAATFQEFLDTHDPTVRTLFYVHGNRVTECESKRRGLRAYHALLDDSGAEPVRFVIWSWPSSQIHGQLKDIRRKAARTNGEAHYLAWTLAQLDASAPVSIVAHSFGARVTTGALHVLGGGQLAGEHLPTAFQRPASSIRVALMAAAMHNYWLRSGSYHGLAMQQMERLLIQYNSCDPVLRYYRLIEKHSRVAALGYTGMCLDDSLETAVEQVDVCCVLGKTHGEADYMCSERIVQHAQEVLLD